MSDIIYLAPGNLVKTVSGSDLRQLLAALPTSPVNPGVQLSESSGIITVQVLGIESWPLHADEVEVEFREEGEETWNLLGNVTLSSGPSFQRPETGPNHQIRFVAKNPNGAATGDYITT